MPCLFSCTFSLPTLCFCVTILIASKEFILSASGCYIALVISLHRGSCKHQLQGHSRSISDEILRFGCPRGRWKLRVSNWDCCSLFLANVGGLFCRIKIRKWMNSPSPSFADNYFPSWRNCNYILHHLKVSQWAYPVQQCSQGQREEEMNAIK